VEEKNVETGEEELNVKKKAEKRNDE